MTEINLFRAALNFKSWTKHHGKEAAEKPTPKKVEVSTQCTGEPNNTPVENFYTDVEVQITQDQHINDLFQATKVDLQSPQFISSDEWNRIYIESRLYNFHQTLGSSLKQLLIVFYLMPIRWGVLFYFLVFCVVWAKMSINAFPFLSKL